MSDTPHPDALLVADDAAPSRPTSDRRNLLRLAGAAAAGVAVAAAAGGRSAQAANGEAIVIGNAVQSGTQPTGLIGSSFQTLVSAPAGFALAGGNTSSNATSVGVQGVSSGGAGVQGLNASFTLAPIIDGTGVQGQGDLYGVDGYAESGTGVRGRSSTVAGVDAQSGSYIDLRCIGTGRMWLAEHTLVGVPTSGDYFAGEIIRDGQGNFFACISGDGSGAGKWLTFAGPGTAGALHPLETPARVYDSRKNMAPMDNGTLGTGAARTITVADRRNVSTGAVTDADVVPAGATAVTFNLTVVSTVGTNGFLSINSGVDATVYSSHINWSASGLSLANAGTIGIDGLRQLTVICGGTSTSAHFIVDITGYYA